MPGRLPGTSEAVAEAQAVYQRIDLGRTHLDAVDVHVNGVKVGTAKVDPLVYGLSFGYRF